MRMLIVLDRIQSFRPRTWAAMLALAGALAPGSAGHEPVSVQPALAAQPPQAAPAAAAWADWIERDFPFFSSALDARQAGASFPATNLTPRGLILNLGNRHWVGFDVDLLRVAAIWRGDGVTPKALAPGSYHARD